MDENQSEAALLRRRILIWGGVSVGVLGLLVAGASLAWPRYKTWTSAKALKAAQEAHLAGEYRRQQLFLEQAVQVDSSNLEARRALAEFVGQTGQAHAVDLWARLVEADDHDLRNHSGLVLTLLRKGDVAEAVEAFGRVPVLLRKGGEYARLAAAVAMASGDTRELDARLSELSSAGGAPEELRFSREALNFVSGPAAGRAASAAVLEEFAKGDKLRIRATLVLLSAAQESGVSGAVEALALRLLDRGTQGSSLLPKVQPGLGGLLHHMMTQPAPKPDDVAALMRWMQSQGLVRDALFWCSSLEPATRTAIPVLVQRANCAMQLRSWRELRETVSLGVWGAAREDVVSLVFAARIQRDAGSVANSRATWADAFALAEASPETLRVMQRLAAGWGWRAEEDRCLRVLVRTYPREQTYWGTLVRNAQEEGDSGRLLQLISDWSRAAGEAPRLVAEHFLLGAVLGQLDESQSTRLRELAGQEGALAPLLIAAALQDCRAGRAESTKLAVDPAVLSPRGRLALAIIQLQRGQTAEVAALTAGLGKASLLPEEKVLLAKVQELRPLFDKK